MALSTARIHRVRGRPPLFAAGINSLIHSHSSSVRSLGYVFSFIYPCYTTHEDFSDRLLEPHTLASRAPCMIAQPPPPIAVFSDRADLRRSRGTRHPCSALLALVCEVSIRASAPPAASGPRHSPAAPEAKRRRGLRRDAERSPMAETSSEAHARCPRFSQARSAANGTGSRPPPHRRSRLFCMGGSAQWWVHGPQARSRSETHAICAANGKGARSVSKVAMLNSLLGERGA